MSLQIKTGMKNSILLSILFWLTIVCSSLAWNLHDEKKEHKTLAFETARAFFNQIVHTRSWNSSHGGVYVPITDTVKPNPYLEDPLRDITTVENMKLTKVNPAYMTRQIADISKKEKGVFFHITSLKPVRPENAPAAWEKQWLEDFEKGINEQGGFYIDGDQTVFRYMAPLVTHKSCLQCHRKHDYVEGQIRGGISVTLPFLHEDSSIPLIFGYSIAGLIGLLIILISGILLEKKQQHLVRSNQQLREEIDIRIKAEKEKEKLIGNLQDAMNEIHTLRGIIPICSFCKKIRDDKGLWKQVETYLRDHSDAQFSHGVCPNCYEKRYKPFSSHPDQDKIKKRR